MTIHISDELAMLAVAVERAGDDPDQVLCCRADFESLWLRYKRATQPIEDAYVAEARAEHAAAIAADLVAGVVPLTVVK